MSPISKLVSTKKVLFIIVLLLTTVINASYAQSNITGVLKGLASKDSAIIRIQKSGESYFFKKLGGTSPASDIQRIVTTRHAQHDDSDLSALT